MVGLVLGFEVRFRLIDYGFVMMYDRAWSVVDLVL